MQPLTLIPALILLTTATGTQGPTLSPELKALEWQVGTWEGTMTWKLPGMQGEHKMKFTNEWQGQFLKTTSHMEMNGLALDEVGFVGFDPAKKKYSMHTFTNLVPTPRVEWGSLVNGILRMESEPWDLPGMKGSISRTVTTREEDGAMHMRLELKRADTWDPIAEGTFKKKA